jgi:enterochelin esterase family protein
VALGRLAIVVAPPVPRQGLSCPDGVTGLRIDFGAMGAQAAVFSTHVLAGEIIFRLPDAPGAIAAARVWLDLDHHSEPPLMRRAAGGWELRLGRPQVQRLEYLFAVEYSDGTQAMICDPARAARTRTPFGDHSVIEFPGYREPGWLTAPYAAGSSVSFDVRAPRLRPEVPVTLWSPGGVAASEPLPLLLLHDGPEFEKLAAVTRFSSVLIGAGRLPPHRVALLGPGDRNRWYAASPGYGHALASAVLPRLRQAAAVTGPVTLAGASLGALAALQAATAAPAAFGALFLQSGSFFRADTDQQESSFPRFAAVTSFVAGLSHAPPEGAVLDIGMTCGLAEENLANNRLMAQTLAGLGHRVQLAEVPDAHTWAGWRDALDPHLAELLARVWGPGGGGGGAGAARLA